MKSILAPVLCSTALVFGCGGMTAEGGAMGAAGPVSPGHVPVRAAVNAAAAVDGSTVAAASPVPTTSSTTTTAAATPPAIACGAIQPGLHARAANGCGGNATVVDDNGAVSLQPGVARTMKIDVTRGYSALSGLVANCVLNSQSAGSATATFSLVGHSECDCGKGCEGSDGMSKPTWLIPVTLPDVPGQSYDVTVAVNTSRTQGWCEVKIGAGAPVVLDKPANTIKQTKLPPGSYTIVLACPRDWGFTQRGCYGAQSYGRVDDNQNLSMTVSVAASP